MFAPCRRPQSTVASFFTLALAFLTSPELDTFTGKLQSKSPNGPYFPNSVRAAFKAEVLEGWRKHE